MTLLLQNSDADMLGKLLLGKNNKHNKSSRAAVSDIIEALAKAAGYSWSTDGKRLWRAADPDVALEWRQLSRPTRGRPRRRATRRWAGWSFAHQADAPALAGGPTW